MKIYLVYDKNTKIIKGNESSEGTAKRKIKADKDNDCNDCKIRNYKNCDCIEIENDEWLEFIGTNPEIQKIVDGNLVSEKRVNSFKKLKDNILSLRKAYLRETAIEWGGAWDDCPKEILDKRKLARVQKKEIKDIDNREDLELYKEF